MILAWLSTAWADPALTEQRVHHRNTGSWLTAVGLASAGGGFAIMTIGRGPSGQISDETQLESDLRSAGGGILLISGITTAALGIHHLNEARVLRQQEKKLAFAIGPSGLWVTGGF